jgi:hypothetical protein
MHWRAIVDAAYARREGARPRYEPPTTDECVSHVERGLGNALPADLKALLLESNGIMELVGIDGGWIENIWVVWKVEEVLARNTELRRERGERGFPSGALAFADAGVDGILFALDVEGRSGVFAWRAIGAEREAMAFSLHDFLCKWIAGELSV